MRLALPLGAAIAAVLLTVGTVVAVVQDDEIRDCVAVLADLNTANIAHQDALRKLDRAWVRVRRDGVVDAGVDAARLVVEQKKRDLDAARAEFAQRCHYDDGQPVEVE